MIHIYNSHSLDKLAHYFSDILQEERSDPLQPTWIIVQNNEIKEWLSLQLASKQGIAGNFRFIFPSEFMWVLYRLKEKDIPQSLPSDLAGMQWALFDLFEKKPELLDLIPVYDTESDSLQKRFQLSGQVADIFDQYQVYRPKMIQSWLDNNLSTNNKHEKWQSALWKRLNEYWNKNELTHSIPSRSEAYNDLVSWMLGKEEDFTKQLPERIFVFGLSHLNKPFLEIISHLSTLKNVHFFHRYSLQSYKNKDLQKLLSSWNASSKDQFHLFQSLLKNLDSEVNTVELDESQVSSIPEISVHSCHNSRREVQVLKDSVLDYFEEHPNAGPGNVLVLVADAETYSSELEMIFEGNENEPSIPITQLHRNQQSDIYTLTALLDAIDSSHKPSTILELINLEPIKKTFSFTDDELERLEEWVINNKVHRGIGSAFNSPYSWQKGVNQLLLGFFMEPGEIELYRDLIPYRSIASNEDIELTARFSSFIDSLIEAANGAQEAKTPMEWLNYVDKLYQTFLGGTIDEASGIHRILESLKEYLHYSNVSGKIPFQMMISWIKSQFSTNDSTSGRFGQGITVSSYIPYRSVPFRFIAVMGLNEGVFPRKAIRPEFDLIYASPQPGDRIQKEDDTYLFLETLLAAGDHLHISYQGQDQRSDAKRLPSMLVQQLLDVSDKGRISFYEHKLHPFNRSYFSNENVMRSYSSLNLKIAENLEEQSGSDRIFTNESLKELSADEHEIVSVKDLISFFTNPSKYIALNSLGFSDSIYLNDITDRESFSLNSLESYHLDDFIHASLLKGNSKEDIFEFVKTSGMIPDKLKGEKLFEGEFDQIRKLNHQLGLLTSRKEQIIDVELSIEGRSVIGKISELYGDILVTSRVGKRKPKYEVGHWLKHLILMESGIPIQKSLFLSMEGNELEVLELHSKDIPEDTFSGYLRWFLSKEPMPVKASFFPATSKSYTQKWNEAKDKKSALNEARKTWEPSYKNTFVESNDYYNRVLWRNRDPLIRDDFHDNALKFWEPFLKACEEVG